MLDSDRPKTSGAAPHRTRSDDLAVLTELSIDPVARAMD
jgi:hypothetical protein